MNHLRHIGLPPSIACSALLVFSWLLACPAYALDPACESILAASEARIKQKSWHSVTILRGEQKIESMKVRGKFYGNRDGKWVTQTVNLDEQEQAVLEKMRSTEVLVSECVMKAEEVLDGINTIVMRMHLQVVKGPGLDVQINIGKDDGLPYAQFSNNTETRYHYKKLVPPKL
jgi:hypothetical protein